MEQPDPRAEKLVALLYGELSRPEEAAIRKMLDEDPALRAQWDELVSARSLLEKWEVAEAAPELVFLREDAGPRASSAAAARPAGRGDSSAPSRPGHPSLTSRPARELRRGWRERLGRLGLGTAWGLAATAALALILAVSHVRIERVNGGFAFLTGPVEKPAPSLAVVQPSAREPEPSAGARLPVAQEAAPSVGGRLPVALPEGIGIETVSGGSSPYLTKDEFLAYAAGMTQTMVSLLNQYGQQRDRDVASLFQAAVGEMEKRQDRRYEELQGRIETVGLGLARNRYDTGVRLEELSRRSGDETPGSEADSSRPQSEGEEK